VTAERAPEWSMGEFAILLASPRVSKVDLLADLPGRTAGAIDVVRQGVHLMHQALPAHGMLSAQMVRFLEPRVAASGMRSLLGITN